MSRLLLLFDLYPRAFLCCAYMDLLRLTFVDSGRDDSTAFVIGGYKHNHII